MVHSFLLAVTLLSSLPSVAQTNEVLANQDIVTMVRAGLGESIIIEKILSSTNDFKLSTDDVIALKKAGVSDRIIGTMLQVRSGAPQTPLGFKGANENTADDLSVVFAQVKIYEVGHQHYNKPKLGTLRVYPDRVSYIETNANNGNPKHSFTASCSEIKDADFNWLGKDTGNFHFKVKGKSQNFYAGELASTIITRIRRNCSLS